MSAAGRTTGGWSVGGASARGASHVRRQLPNQDALLWWPQGGAGHQVLAAVSDGHGAAAHHRSDVGARLAVQSVAEVFDWFWEGGIPPGELPEATLATWRQAVQAHAAEQAGGWVEPVADTLLPYGATLVALAAGEREAVALQIGDGDLFLGYPDGRLLRPLPDDRGLVGEQTYSLCAADAAARFRLAVLRWEVEAEAPDFALLATDGVAKSFGDEPAVLDVVRHYRRTLLAAPMAEVVAGLPAWLSEISRRGSGDDATLCLAVRKPAAAHQPGAA